MRNLDTIYALFRIERVGEVTNTAAPGTCCQQAQPADTERVREVTNTAALGTHCLWWHTTRKIVMDFCGI